MCAKPCTTTSVPVLNTPSGADLHDDVRKLSGFWSERAATLARFTAGKAALDQMVTLAEHLPELASPGAAGTAPVAPPRARRTRR